MKILMVCLGNICRSPLAEGIMKQKIREAQLEALRAVNKYLIDLYWDIGKMIVERQEAHGWGKSVVERLSEELQLAFPGTQGYSVQNLWYMRQFYNTYENSPILQPLVGEISWTKHIVILSKCKTDLEFLTTVLSVL